MKYGHVALVNLHKDLSELLRYNLSKDAVQVQNFRSGQWALMQMRHSQPDIVICTAQTDDMSWQDLYTGMQHNPSLKNTPFILLDTKPGHINPVRALDMGVEAYFEKPVRVSDLLQRTRRILNNDFYKVSDCCMHLSGPVAYKNIMLSPNNYSVWLDERLLNVSEAEFRLLRLFVCKPGRIYTTSFLERELRDILADGPCQLSSLVQGLRRKLGRHHQALEYVEGLGYRLNDMEPRQPVED